MFPTRRSNLLTQTIQDEVVILDRAGGQVHRLNTTASYIWELCDGHTAPVTIAARLADACGRVPADVMDDVVRTLDELRALSLLESDTDPPSIP